MYTWIHTHTSRLNDVKKMHTPVAAKNVHIVLQTRTRTHTQTHTHIQTHTHTHSWVRGVLVDSKWRPGKQRSITRCLLEIHKGIRGHIMVCVCVCVCVYVCACVLWLLIFTYTKILQLLLHHLTYRRSGKRTVMEERVNEERKDGGKGRVKHNRWWKHTIKRYKR